MLETHQPPSHLSAESQEWWRKLQDEYVLEDEAAHLLLQTALEAYDRMKAAQAEITKDGLSIRDRWGQVKSHPLATVERDSRSQMLMALKALNLDMEPVKPAPGRPGGT